MKQKVCLRPTLVLLPQRLIWGLVSVLTLALLVPVAYTEGPLVYAIKDARIVTVTNGTLAKGTVVFRDGLIETVGERVAIPEDARIIDGSGLTVYPGLIDAHTDLALEQPQPTPRSPRLLAHALIAGPAHEPVAFLELVGEDESLS